MSVLHITHLNKIYTTAKGKHHVLHDINLTINQNEILSLLGVNGAGKTTLSSIIATLHPATSGNIWYQEASIYKNIDQFRAQIGYCPQKPNLNTILTLKENLFFAGKFYGLNNTQIATRITELTEQFDLGRYLNEKASLLSGGYKQRFMLARSLIHKPKLLILDEPTVGLDPHIRRNLWQLIKNLKKTGVTVLLTTHYLDEAEKLSDRVCILHKGHIALIETPATLMADFKKNNLEDVFIELLKANNEESI